MRAALISYSDRSALALALWPLASLVFTVPILAFLYHRDGRLHLSSIVGCYIAVFYLMGLGCFTLYPLPTGDSGPGITYGISPQLNFWQFVTVLRSRNKVLIFELFANVALFVPFGFIVARGLGWGPARSVLAGFAVSLLVETTQLTGDWGVYDFAYRTFDVDDLLTNTVGSFVGWILAEIYSCLVPRRTNPMDLEPTRRAGVLRRAVALAVDSILVFVLAVIFVVGAQYVLRHNLVGSGRLSRAIEWLTHWSMFAFMVLLQLIVPLAWGGKTIGSSFVRMNYETKPRRGVLRAAFFGVRFVALLLAARFPLCVLVPLAAFGAVFKQMPYDFLPASSQRRDY
ncbi:VanZ family protein [Paratractidigestivibacter sp.]|uniref:VanZ family protein n=1 Tax=Paratractidigestivibacter sp. TaxID=2847316 RepID=UPI002AC9A675|nr:VanZ family protein [Paratractidigestivibacter sp.]